MNSVDADKLLIAMLSAYVWVASADEDGVTIEEYNSFEKVIVGSPFATHFSFDNMRHTFKDLVAMFNENYDYGIDLTRKHLHDFVNQPIMAEEILRLARMAAVGDGKLKDVEEIVLKEITAELGINHETF